MKILRNYKSISTYTKNSTLVIGNFDGVHKGHQKIIQSAKKVNNIKKNKIGVLLFDPHPKIFFKTVDKNFLLTDLNTRCKILKSYGIDFVIILKFSKLISEMSPNNFCHKILKSGIQMKHILVGKNFKFGKKRIGNYKFLEEYGKCNEFKVSPIDIFKLPEVLAKKIKKNTYSSSNIRSLIQIGDVHSASKLLNRPWYVFGKVIEGDKRGRTIGIPTANMSLDGYKKLCYGVYAVSVDIQGNRSNLGTLKGIANFGIRPTFKKKKPILEIYLFDFDLNIYQSTLKVSFIDFIRKEKKFLGIESLKKQLIKDISKANRILR